ncbi:MAG TPA: hypothetical protein VFM40_07340 [Actinomycetota bacterium]|nr:hypothetical protein [Actinomycetota bacterium]
MEDFNALAISLGLGMADVRGCLVLSRDGLVLGAHPAESERATTRAWIRFATIGDPERGFVQFGTETWCYVRREPYAGFAVAGPGERAGLVIDHMERVLEAAEERRSGQEGPGVIEGEAEAETDAEIEAETQTTTVAPRYEPTPYLDLEHPAPDPLVIHAPAPTETRSWGWDPAGESPRSSGLEPETIDEPIRDDAESAERQADPVAEFEVDASDPDARPSWEPTSSVALPDPERWLRGDPRIEAEPQPEPVDQADEGSGAGSEADAETGTGPEDKKQEEDDDVDRFSLAREFGRLLQGGDGPADG